ncbi:MAG TPA: VOC family protein [Dongiaceae bacterium]|jgi:catechol 2,3-dioxygenase-like lactoylglutathione lyase family enzyme
MKLSLRRITLFTADLAAMVAFYRDALDLDLVVDEPGWKEFDAGECRIALHNGKSRVGARAPKLGFYVKDVAKAKAELEARGVKLGEIKSFEKISFCDGKDPDGNAFSLTNRR